MTGNEVFDNLGSMLIWLVIVVKGGGFLVNKCERYF